MTDHTPAAPSQEAEPSDDQILDVFAEFGQPNDERRTMTYNAQQIVAAVRALLSKLRAPVTDAANPHTGYPDLADAWQRGFDGRTPGWSGLPLDVFDATYQEGKRARAALTSAPVAGEAKPVAWLMKRHGDEQFEIAEPHEKASNPLHWSDAFPVYGDPKALTVDVIAGNRYFDCGPQTGKVTGDAFDEWYAKQNLCKGSDLRSFRFERNGSYVSLPDLLREAWEDGAHTPPHLDSGPIEPDNDGPVIKTKDKK